MNVLEVVAPDALRLFRDISAHKPQSHLTGTTLRAANAFASGKQGAGFRLVSLSHGDFLVRNGELASELQLPPSFCYAPIPLMLIVRGAVTIIENDKAVKRKVAGDLIGDFEVAHVLHSRKSERVGKWDVLVDESTDLLVFDDALATGDPAARRFARFLVDLARRDPVPNTVSTLPLLDWTAKHFSPGLLDGTMLVLSSHLVPSNAALIRHLTALVGYENVVVLEKAYSTIRETYAQVVQMGVDIVPVLPATGLPYELAAERSVSLVWNKVVRKAYERDIRRIVIFDDGGALLTSVPWDRLAGTEITGFEQTTLGLERLKGTGGDFPPVVNVAGSFAKRDIESTYIGSAVVSKLQSLRVFSKLRAPRIGIIGNGAIGTAIAQSLDSYSRLSVYDYAIDRQARKTDGKYASSLDSLLNDSDVIIGCTGLDCLKRVALDRVHGTKLLVSVSSRDQEFFSLLNIAGFSDSGFGAINVSPHPMLGLSILNGGFPINFDRTKEWEPPEDIQLTRSLLYLGFVQALGLTVSSGKGLLVDLDESMQQRVVNAYYEMKRRSG